MISLVCPDCTSTDIEAIEKGQLKDKELKKMLKDKSENPVHDTVFRCSCGKEFRFADADWTSGF